MLLDQPRNPVDRQMSVPDREQQFRCNRISFDAAMPATCEHVGPPLQTYLTRQRLAHQETHTDNLDIEGIEREQ